MRILCSGGWGYGNLGDDSILQGTLNGLQKVFPRAELTVTSFSPTDTNSRNNVHSIPSIRNLCLSSERTGLKTAIRYGAAYACLLKTVRKNALLLSQIRDFYDGYDLFVQAGGGYLNSIFWRALPWYALELSCAIDTHTKVAVVGQTIGPFKLIGKQIAQILRDIQFTYVRDRSSLTLLRGLGISHARMCADSAFLSEPKVTELPEKDGDHVVAFLSPGRLFVAGQSVHVNMHSFERVKQNLIDAIGTSKATDHPIIFTVSTLDNHNWLQCQDLAQKMCATYSNVDVEVLRLTSLRDFVRVINGAKLCISTNLHPLILATMLHVPGVGVTTHAKTIDFMHEYGQGERAIPLHRLERGGSVLSELISSALDLSEGKLSLLQACAAKAKKDAFRPFREIAELLN